MADFTAADLQKLTVVELQHELKRRGLKKTGVKAKLIVRLLEHMQLTKEQESQQNEIAPTHQNVVDSRQVINTRNTSIAENAECEQQLLNDSNISVDDYLNPMFTKSTDSTLIDTLPNSETLDAVTSDPTEKPLNETKTNVVQDHSDARDFAEEFTEPIHQPDSESHQRVIELAPSTDGPDKAHISDDDLTDSVTVIHQTLDDQEASNLSFNQDEISNDVEMESLRKDDDKNVDSRSDESIDKSQEDQETSPQNNDSDTKGVDEREEVIADVLHTDQADDVADHRDNENNQVDNENRDDDDDETISENIRDNENDGDNRHDRDNDEREQNDEVVNVSTVVEHTNEDNITMDADENEFMEHAMKRKVEKKPVVPVALKKRVVLKGSSETPEEKAARRKRRWGSTSMKDSTVPISGESIQKLIPDVKIDASVIENEPELDYQEDEESQAKESEQKIEADIDSVVDNGEKVTPSKKRRTVKLDSAKKVTLGAKDSSDTVVIDAIQREPIQQPTRSIQSMEVEDDIEEHGKRDKSPSPAKNEPSLYLHVENLVRPYTVNQLKQLLRKTGNFPDDKFWINNIKSHCYVMYSSQDEATQTREALHGMKWPPGTPKTLKVDYAFMEKMWSDTAGSFGEEPKVIIEIDDKENETKEISRRVDRETRKSLDNERKKKQEKEEKSKKESAPKTEREESPAKLLDDLFRKTKATPCIYWLPLTEEQIVQKEKAAAEKGQVDTRHSENPNDSRREPQGRRVSPERRMHSHRGGGRSWR